MDIALTVLGGLGLFLYGMTTMSDGLQKTAGNELKKIIEILTTNIYMGILVGTLVTVLIQSSSGTTVMVIGFVNAGIMSLTQAAGVIMGANIGTTITGQIIALNLSEYAPIAVIAGVVLLMFSPEKRTRDIAEVIIGIGILFIGMDMMSSGLVLLSKYPEFIRIMSTLDNPFLGIIFGFVLTTLVQSSSASVGMLQALGTEGLININRAVPILLGGNIGTTTTGMLSSIGAKKNAKRAAIINLIFKIVGTVVFMLFLDTPVRKLILAISPTNVPRQIANTHSLFNIISVLILLPFVNIIIKIANWIVPGEDEEEETATIYLDKRITETPSIALGQVHKEILRMTDLVLTNLVEVKEALISKDASKSEDILEREDLIDQLDQEITNYLIDLSNQTLSDLQQNEINKFLYTVNDLERMGDHVNNLEELTQYMLNEDISFTDPAMQGLTDLFNKCIEVVTATKTAFEYTDTEVSKKIQEIEDEVDRIEESNRNKHIERSNKKICGAKPGMVFLEALSNLERLSDHANNIADYILNTF